MIFLTVRFLKLVKMGINLNFAILKHFKNYLFFSVTFCFKIAKKKVYKLFVKKTK